MVDVRPFLDRLARAGAQVWVDGEALRYRPPGSISAADLGTLRQHRAEVIAELRLATAGSDDEARLAEIWALVLGVPRVGRGDDFLELGGTPDQAAAVAARITDATGLDIAPETIVDTGTVAALASRLGRVAWRIPVAAIAGGSAASRFDAERAVGECLEAGLPPAGLPGCPPRHILLTGATGFVGRHVLAELLARPDTTVHCLVRGTARPARERLRNLARSAGASAAYESGRIRLVEGDLARSLLGLDRAAFAALADRTEAVVHIGADVSGLLPYDRLADANVNGTCELVRLSGTGRLKSLHYISTAAAADAADLTDASGYAVSKWHGELLVTAAARRGLPTAIYRLPRIMGDSGSGAWNDRDIVQRLLRDILALGAAPDFDHQEDWIAGDVAARGLAELLLRTPSGQRFRVAADHPVELAQVVAAASDAGPPLPVLAMSEWMEALADQAPDEHSLMTEFLFPPNGSQQRSRPPEFSDDGFTALVLPAPTPEAIGNYVRQLRSAMTFA